MTNKRSCLVSRSRMPIAAAGIAGFLLPIQVSIAGPIQINVSFDEEGRAEAASGRILLLLCDDRGRGRNPLSAPFWTDPQPIFSVGVTDLKPGETVTFTEDSKGFPGTLGELKGKYTIAAVLDVDRTTDGFRLSPDNLHSELKHVEFGANEGDEPLVVTLPLTSHFSPREVQSTENVKLVEFESPSLTAFHGFPFILRAGVVLPPSFAGEPDREYAVVYHVPGFGGTHQSAWSRRRADHDLDKHVVHIHLDATGPYGHHLYVNSENNGPIGDALVKELIPHLQREYRLIDRPEARYLTGHSSGGISTVSLQVNYPDFFGGCWSTSPDPVDFSAFQVVNLYEDANLYSDVEGNDHISVTWGGRPLVSIRDEAAMEDALHPRNGSGQQWDSWVGCYSPRAEDGCPQDLWDPQTGDLDHAIAEQWRRHDPAYIVSSQWNTIGPLISSRLRIIVGDEDNFDLDLGVIALRDKLDQLEGWESNAETLDERASRGYIEVIPGRDHFNIFQTGLRKRIADEMYRALELSGIIPPGDQ